MSGESQSTLEERIASVEKSLKTLTDNLAINNTTLLNFLRVLVDDKARGEDKRAAFKDCEGGICTTDPPGCKKDKDKDHN